MTNPDQSIFKGVPFDIGPLYAATDEAQRKINPCTTCDGTGTIPYIDGYGQADEAPCEVCGGSGRKASQ